MASRTIASLFSECRTLLQDKDPAPAYRYLDGELMEAFNAFLLEARVKRPDLFIDLGLRVALPFYTTDDMSQLFPLPAGLYNPALYYVVGRSELREDPFADDARATVLMNKSIAQLMQVVS